MSQAASTAAPNAAAATDTRRAPILYNLGAGARPLLPQLADRRAFAGWQEIRVDFDADCQPDILADLTDTAAAIPDGVADLVYCSHVLEHFHDHQVPAVLAGILRILRPGAMAVLRVPDLTQAAALLAAEDLERTLYTSAAGPVSVLDVIYGHRRSIAQGKELMAHRTGFTEAALARRLLAAGFAEVRTVPGPSVEFCAMATAGPLVMTPQAAALLDFLNPPEICA